MNELQTSVAAVKAKIEKYRSKGIGEQDTKAGLIQPILRALGWDVEDPDEVAREFKLRRQDKPVDYALLLLRNPCLFMEAKGLGKNLNDRKWANQIAGYATQSGVEWVVLTDGDEYRIYNSHAPVPLEEKLFRTIRISDDDESAVKTLALLSKERMREKRIDSFWNAHFVDRKVRAAVEALFATDPEPDPSVVRLISKRVDKLSAGSVKASLRRVRIQFDFPPGADDLVESAVVSDETKRHKAKGQAKRKKKAHVGVSLNDLIDTGILKPPLKLVKRYKGHDLEATVHADGSVTFNGTSYNSGSTAAEHARATVTGRPMNTNGWAFWQFVGKDGKRRSLDELRQQFLETHSNL